MISIYDYLVAMDLALTQGEVEKRIQAVQDEVKKQDDAIKELQRKFKVSWWDSYGCAILGGEKIIRNFPMSIHYL